MKRTVSVLLALILLVSLAAPAFAKTSMSVTVSNKASTGKITLKWTAVKNAAKYDVLRAAGKQGSYSKIKTVTGLSTTDTTAKAGTTYYYKLRAKNAGGKTILTSKEVKRCCDCAKMDVKATWSGSGKSVFKWDKINGATSYKVYRANSAKADYKLIAEVKSTSFTDKKATPGHVYRYKFTAVSSKSSSATSAAFKINFCAKPAAPEGFTLTKNKSGSVVASWDKSTGAQGYVVLYGKSASDLRVFKDMANRSSCTLGASGGSKQYYFSVAAYCITADGSCIFSSASKPKKAAVRL